MCVSGFLFAFSIICEMLSLDSRPVHNNIWTPQRVLVPRGDHATWRAIVSLYACSGAFSARRARRVPAGPNSGLPKSSRVAGVGRGGCRKPKTSVACSRRKGESNGIEKNRGATSRHDENTRCTELYIFLPLKLWESLSRAWL